MAAAHRFTLRLPEELFQAVTEAAGKSRRPIAAEMRVLLKKAVTPDHANVRQLAALHARADILDRTLGVKAGHTKREALADASEQFRREITSAADLSFGEASWILDWLRARLEA